MVLPATYASALFALVVALACFTLWPVIYKRVQARWRFELFALDFALGALLFALIAAYTLGTLGREMSFSDRMLVAGRSAGLWVFATGVIFAFGNTLLLVSISLLGLAAALPIGFGFAGLLIAATHFRFLAAAEAITALVLLGLTVLLAALGPRPTMLAARRKFWVKGVGLAIWAGAPLALAEWMLRHTSDPEFGPGPYASVLLLALGFVFATPIYDFFFMHIKISGNPIGFAHYKLGGFRIHLPGILSGAIWGAGMLALLAAFNATGDAELSVPVRFILPLMSIVLCTLFGLFARREYTGTPRLFLLIAVGCFAAGVVALALAYPASASSP